MRKIIVLLGIFFMGMITHAQTPMPPAPSIIIDPITYDDVQNRYNVPLRITNPALIGWLQVQIISRNTQTVVFGPTRFGVSSVLQFPATGLTDGEGYLLYIEALNSTSMPIMAITTNNFGQTAQAPVASTYEFTHTAPNLQPSFQIVAVDFMQALPAFIITLSTQNATDITQYEVWLQNQDTGLRQTIHTFSAPTDNRLQLPVDGVQNGKYNVVVNAQNSARQTLFTGQFMGVTLNVAVDLLAPLKSPVAIGAIVLILLLLIILFVRATHKPRVMVITPPSQPPPMGPTIPPPSILRQKTNALLREMSGSYQETKITFSPFSVGRYKSSLIIPHEKISKSHFLIVYSDKEYRIRDLGSANGTFLNGKRLIPNDDYIVRSGDVIGLGDVTKFQFEIPRD